MRWIIVGAGSAGCVVARRLIDAGHDVVLIESGPPLRPGAVPASIDGPDSFAAIRAHGRTYPDLLARRTESSAPTPYLRGRGEGGSSAVNFMVGLRGDLNLYASWGWHDAAECFDMIEVPTETAAESERGRVSTALLEAHVETTPSRLTRRNARRVTAAESYLWPVLDRFEAVADTTVDRVRFDSSGRAIGVLTADGVSIDADAVVLAAGAIHSPAIALRSGVGGADGGEVGRGLADHPAVGLTLRLKSGSSSFGLSTSTILDLDPIQILPLDHLGAHAPTDLAMLLVGLMRPQSAAGSVSLRSDDPNDHPHVDLGLLCDDADVERLRGGVHQARDVLDTTPFRSLVAEVFVDDIGTPLTSLRTNDDVDRWITSRGADYVHASSSMSRTLGEVGAVLGHEQLWVADASAFPSIPNVNTHLPTMMLAERFVRAWIDGVA
ncbi:MAG: GMC family oxidoreductase [Ilumatobacter sp.]